MATARPFTYNTGSTISGTDQLVDLAIGPPNNYSGYSWWNGADEELGYVFCKSVPLGNQPTPIGNIGNVQFWRTNGFVSDSGYTQFVKDYFGIDKQNTGTARKELNTQGYWTSYGGSMSFLGNLSSYAQITNDVDLRLGTGDFSIEWWQYQTDSNPYSRPWSMGTWPSATVAVSLESGNFYFWFTGITGISEGYVNVGNIEPYLNTWVYFCVYRNNRKCRVFKDGTQVGTEFDLSYNHTDSLNKLSFGNESDLLYSTSSYGGYITNFHWVKGSALHWSEEFSPPNTNVSPTDSTKLLLLCKNQVNLLTDSSGLNKKLTSSNVNWTYKYPY